MTKMQRAPEGVFGACEPFSAKQIRYGRRQMLWGMALASLLLGLVAPCTRAVAEDLKSADCLACHEDKELSKTDAVGTKKSLYVDAAKLGASIHKANECVNCHSDVTSDHPGDSVPVKLANCVGCHEAQPEHQKASDEYASSIHGVSHKLGASAAATCSSCHGSHEIQSNKNVDSPVFKMNLPGTCSKCHTNADLTKDYQIKYPAAAAQYLDSIHGRALLKLGLIVAPSCNDCHGVHDIKRSVDRDSPINRVNVAKTCGKCHVTIENIYNRSVHGQMLAKGVPGAPVCTDCHSAHSIENPGSSHFKAGSDQRCGRCHMDRLEFYHETYHGKAMALGRPNDASEVAACYDCHGHHNVLPASDPESTLSPKNIVGTCARCHPSATASFAKYVPHANPLDKTNYPQFHWVFLFMTALLIGVFTFFGGHTIFWLFRSAYLYVHDSKKFREAKISTQTDDEWFTRFSPFERFQHILLVSSFLLLVITGMPLKFYYTDWAKVLFSLLGGTQTARALHHFGAIITFLYFALHLYGVASNTWRRRGEFFDPTTGKFSIKRVIGFWMGPDSMIPTLQDAKDFIEHQKWFFGTGPRPQFDRWTYWEKFDYFAVFWGVAIIGFSGMIMWFPVFFSQFMPGWGINIALIVHSDEALLAAGFIFTVHFFNSHFRLEKFPMDTVIFSGRLSKTEMLHERKRWYDRLVASKRLDDYRIRDEWERWKGIARSFGYLFFGLGVILLVLIVYAMLSRLTHSPEPHIPAPVVHEVKAEPPR